MSACGLHKRGAFFALFHFCFCDKLLLMDMSVFGRIFMLVYTVNNTKKFMSMLLKENVFDLFEVRSALITTFTAFEIDGKLNKDFFDEENKPDTDYCLWEKIKPFAFEIIKGKKMPKLIKLVFAAPPSLKNKISPASSVLFLNITFENNAITLITGSSMKTFTMDKSAEYLWDEYIDEFLSENEISVSTQLD